MNPAVGPPMASSIRARPSAKRRAASASERPRNSPSPAVMCRALKLVRPPAWSVMSLWNQPWTNISTPCPAQRRQAPVIGHHQHGEPRLAEHPAEQGGQPVHLTFEARADVVDRGEEQ